MRTCKRLPKRVTVLSVVLFFLITNSLFAQTRTVTGTVVDSKSKDPLSGVSVSVKGTKTGTVTNAEGKFSISVLGNPVLILTSTGYENLEIKTDAAETISVELVSLNLQLNDIVVVGYGRQKKATLTGAVEVINSKTFENRAVTNIGLALQGQTPGLLVTRSSPRPGNEGLAFKIRGATSVNGGNPLIVIDGVPALGGVNGAAFQNLNSDDLESFSILKDGAAAIYGSRAANGVVLITTKRAKGKLKVDYSNNLRFTTNGITDFSPNMQQYASVWLEANKEETVPNYWVWGNKDNLLKMQQGVEGAYQLFGVDYYIFNANRVNEMFATRYSYQHNLSLSNSNDKSGYRLSFGYADNQGNLATAYDGQKQINARFSYDYKLSEKLKLESNISMINTVTSMPSVGLDETLYGNDMPFFPAKNPFGQWFPCFNGIDGGARRNAAATTSDGGRNDIKTLIARIDLKGTYQITRDLAFETMASFQDQRRNQERYVLPVPLYNWYGKFTGYGLYTDGNNNVYQTSSSTDFYQYYSGLLRYNKSIRGLHNISATAGINAEKYNWQGLSASRIGFENLGVQDISLASTAVQTNGGGKTQNGMYSYIARVNYNYAEKYLVEILGRRDGNSKFADGYKFKNFGSASVGWVFTNEKFLESITSVLNFGKVRASFGSSGNDVGLGDFEYISLVNIGSAVLGLPPTVQNASSLAYNGLKTPTRTWERVQQKNIGIDLSFFKSRLTTNFDYFVKDNIGMFINVTYPGVLGGTPPPTNSGHFNTKGWEAVISWKDSKKDFSYNVSLNMGDTKTLVSGVEGKDGWGAGRNGIVNGYAFQPWFVYQTDGYFKNQAEVDAYYAKYGASTDLAGLPQINTGVALRPGDTKKIDVAGTGNITGNGNEKSSLVYKGDGTPHYTFGANMGASWKGFDLNAFFQGQLKQLIMRSGWMSYPFAAIYTNQNPSFLGKTWTSEKTDAVFPRLTVNTTRARWNYANNDFMLQNNRYIRLKALIVGYTLPQQITRKIKLERVRVYFSGNDLWEWASIKDGFDPEHGETSQNSGYPFARTWAFGLNVGL